MITGPTIKRGQSKTTYGTPWSFIKAVETRFGKLAWDLAADKENKKAPNWLTEYDNSLKFNWHNLPQIGVTTNLLYLNPPFDLIEPWAEKCSREAQLGAKILFLTPASIGSNWFRDHIYGQALVLALNGRLTFEGETTPYPKDCILSCYGWKPGFEVWTWNKEATIFD